jgi:hypothetical protein
MRTENKRKNLSVAQETSTTSPGPFFGVVLVVPLPPPLLRPSVVVRRCVVVVRRSSLARWPVATCLHRRSSLPRCPPFPPHEQWLVAVVQGGVVAVAALVVSLYIDQT